MGKVRVLLFVVLAAFLTASTGFAAEKGFKAMLNSKEEVHKPKSKASGRAEFKLIQDGKELSYKLHVRNITNVNAAHIHVGAKGVDGPPVVGLFSGEKKGKFSGMLSEGTITEQDLMGEYKGKPIDELVKLIKSGEAYVNVHTDANPAGEIRGQIK